MKPLGQSRDSTTPENSVVCGLSPARRLALSPRKPPFPSTTSYPGVGAQMRRNRGAQWLGLEQLAGDEGLGQIKKLDLWEQRCLGGAYSKWNTGQEPWNKRHVLRLVCAFQKAIC